VRVGFGLVERNLSRTPDLPSAYSARPLGDGGAQALAGSPHLANLTYLCLWANDITNAGLQALLDSPYLPRLQYLILGCNRITEPAPSRPYLFM
jgi:hypothetical protein